ncbi:MAG: NifU family protein, partial [Phototrophicales bacterium]
MLQVRIQGTPNPNARKFILNTDVKRSGKVTYKDPMDCSHVPLAKALLQLPHVTQVHFFENVVTISQDGLADWSVLDGDLQDVLYELI